jgi:hypothetical protein
MAGLLTACSKMFFPSRGGTPMSPPPSATAQPAEENKSQLTKRLFLEIQSAVKERNIAHAEALREQLIAVNPMALGEIIKSAELIE